jgi:hypothetical protein
MLSMIDHNYLLNFIFGLLEFFKLIIVKFHQKNTLYLLLKISCCIFDHVNIINTVIGIICPEELFAMLSFQGFIYVKKMTFLKVLIF